MEIVYMIEICFKDTKEKIQSMLKKYKEMNQDGILCLSCETDIENPLMWKHFFSLMDGFFWATPKRDFEMMGLNPITYIQHQTPGMPFHTLKEKWAQCMKNAESLVDDGLGLYYPLSFGAFTFDSEKECIGIWKDLGKNLLAVPEFLCVRKNTTVSYVLQVYVTKHTHYEELEEKLHNYAQLFKTMQNEHIEQKENIFIAKKELPFEKWADLIDKARHEILQGHLKKVVLARETELCFKDKIDVSQMLARLYTQQADSYIFLLRKAGESFIGATPERLVFLENQEILSACVAGTKKRGKTEAEDKALGKQLLADDKNLREHNFVVEKVQEIMVECCDTYIIQEKPSLLKSKFIQHLYTPVKGRLKQNIDLFSVIEKMHPTPALGGMPKEKALQFLREEEPFERGWYGAPIGWFDCRENGEFIVGIRSGLVQNQKLTLFAGCGVVVDSDAKMEYEETALKLKPMLESLGEKVVHGK